jgi:hypothetical protein
MFHSLSFIAKQFPAIPCLAAQGYELFAAEADRTIATVPARV